VILPDFNSKLHYGYTYAYTACQHCMSQVKLTSLPPRELSSVNYEQPPSFEATSHPQYGTDMNSLVAFLWLWTFRRHDYNNETCAMLGVGKKRKA